MSNIESKHRSRGTLSRLFVLAAVAAPALGACAPDRVIQSTSIPSDFRARHPIALTHAPSQRTFCLRADVLMRAPKSKSAYSRRSIAPRAAA